ncbi:MAG: hypothetical protein RLZZ558_1885 [Planctomycetota bacterium]
MRPTPLLVATILASPLSANASVILTDGDFGTATLGNYGTTTTSRLANGGDPDARIQVTTVSGTGTGGLIINAAAVTGPLEGASFNFGLSVLKGAGSFGEGQSIGLVIKQGSTIWLQNLYVTGVRSNWTSQTFSGTLLSTNFTRVSGSSTGGPILDGSVTTYFGFSASNSNSGTLTQYYDNWTLGIDTTAVPAPAAFGLLAMCGLAARRRA